MKKKFLMGFSLIEVLIALIIVSVLMAASVPILTKKAQNIAVLGGSQSEEIKAECSIFGSDCSLCYSSKCIVCNKTCLETQFKDIENCNCKNCSNEDLGGAGCKKCNKTTCLECDSSKFLNSSNKCTSCPQNATCNGKEMTCKSDYYRKDDTCIKCTDSFGSACTACNKDGCTSCSSGSYATGGSCVSCSTFDTNCTSCSASGCDKCSSGYALKNQKCEKNVSCDVNCASGSCGSDGCTSCRSGYFLYETNVCLNCNYFDSNCVHCNYNMCITCTKGYFSSGKRCERCETSLLPSHCTDCSGVSTCSNCEDGYYLTSDKSCAPCSSKYGSQCSSCNFSTCYDCNGLYYDSSQGKCTSCTCNCATCSMYASCHCYSCKSGYKLVNNSCV